MTNTTIKTRTAVDATTAVDNVSKTSIITMAVASGLVGLWAVSCLVGAFLSEGPVQVIKGFFTAVTGI